MEPGYQIQHRKGHSTRHDPGDICTHKHTHRYKKTTTVTTHVHAETHALRQTDRHSYALTIWVAYASRLFSRESAREVLRIRRDIRGLILSQGCRLLPLKFPPPQMKVALEVEDGMQVFQLLNSSKLFDLLSSNCKSQVAEPPVYEPSHCISLYICVQLCGQTNLRSFHQIHFKEYLSV